MSTQIGDKTIKIASGSDWWIEKLDTDFCTSYDVQKLYPTGEGNATPDNPIISIVKKMPLNWVGTDSPDIYTIPYQMIKKDKYLEYEQVGEWNRVHVMCPVKEGCDLMCLLAIVNRWRGAHTTTADMCEIQKSLVICLATPPKPASSDKLLIRLGQNQNVL